jgi:hypothetical protein
MIPTSDETPRWRVPAVTWALIAINVGVGGFLVGLALGLVLRRGGIYGIA